ncbi:hypothetical protein GOODEAATRI_013583, partial [Goodea atripinnis]
NESTANNDSTTDLPVWQGLLEFIPDKAVENAKLVWQHGRDNQLAIVLRRIDAIASVMWFVILCLYLAESYLANTPSWMDTVKLVNISLCCLVGLAAAAATRKPPGQRRAKYRRSESEQ